MSRTAIPLQFKTVPVINEASCWSEKLLADINLTPLMPDDNNFEGFLVWDFRK